MTENISIYMAFSAGVLSFLSPCVLPLVPGYVSFMSGVSLKQVQNNRPGTIFSRRQHWEVVSNSMFFIIGFSAVFILLGASATWIGAFLTAKLTFFTKAAGLIVMIFGLVKLGVFRPLLLLRQFSLPLKRVKPGVAGAALLGAAFAFAWTPCIGPVLGGILTYAGTLDQVDQGVRLLAVYSAGLGVPFFLTALGVRHFFKIFNRIKTYLGLVEKMTGAVLVAMGALIFSDSLTLIQAYLPFLNQFAL